MGFCTYRLWLAKGVSAKICPRAGKCIFSSIEVTGEAGGDLQAVLRCKVGFCTSRHLNCDEMRGNVSFSYIEVTGESKWAFAPRGTVYLKWVAVTPAVCPQRWGESQDHASS